MEAHLSSTAAGMEAYLSSTAAAGEPCLRNKVEAAMQSSRQRHLLTNPQY